LELPFEPIGTAEQYAEAIADPKLWNPRKAFAVVWRLVREAHRIMYDNIERLAEPGRTVLVGSTLAVGARLAQEKLQLPLATVHLSPCCFLSSYRPPVVKGLPMPAWLPLPVKEAFWWLVERGLIDQICGRDVNRLRGELGLSPVTRIMGRWLHSPDLVLALFPDWFAQPQPDWPANTHLTGFPLFDEASVWSPNPGLQAFLDTKPAPIVFTAGSAMRHAAPFFRNAVEACRRLKQRGLLLSSFADQLPSLPEFIHHEHYAPLSQVLPSAAALVYHGGIGTCAQALAAGVPHLVTPYAHDQFDNAARLRELGVGRAISPGASADRLTEALRNLLGSPGVAVNCQKWRDRISSQEAALASACELIEGLQPSSSGRGTANFSGPHVQVTASDLQR
jgi:rhamnosyltransferase subunit B